jgi:hypothetical protein
LSPFRFVAFTAHIRAARKQLATVACTLFVYNEASGTGDYSQV